MILRGFERIREVKQWHNQAVENMVVESLRKRGIAANFFPDVAAANQYILSIIPEKSVVGLGGSTTIVETGILDELEKLDVQIMSSFAPGLSRDEQLEIMRKILTCDIFLCSANAITIDGKLYNTDGVGNRIAGMLFGPKKTIIVAGTNKIVNNIDEAYTRVKNIAAPMNTRRYYKPDKNTPPCAVSGKCMNCQPPLRICNVTAIIEGKPFGIELEVVLIGEKLGF